MSLKFEVLATKGAARAGRITTPHGVVETPVFMPVGTAATVKGLTQEQLEELGVQILLNNTYHLYLRPGVETVRAMGGSQRFMSWNKPILTDSGGFQVFSLSSLRKLSEQGVEFRSHLDGSRHMFSPESSIMSQIGIGADIIMAFDECTETPATHERTRESMELTLRWLKRSHQTWIEHRHEAPWAGERTAAMGSAQHPSLFGIVQGGMYADLRRESVERTLEIDCPGYALGGLSVGEEREKTWEMVETSMPLMPSDKPRYVMGVGTPEEIVRYISMGVDMMDCVLPTRAARHGLLFTSQGRVNIKNACHARDESPIDPNCSCRVCARYSRGYLRHLFQTNEMLGQTLNSLHNLAFYLDTVRRVRQDILLGRVTPTST